MKYREDARSIFICILTLGLMIFSLSVDFNSYWLFLLIPLQTFLCFTCCIINHNHTHNSIFEDERYNSIFELMITVAKGHTSLGVVVPHNLNHHVHVGTKYDWSRDEIAGKGWGVFRILRYVVGATVQMGIGRKQANAPQLTPELTQRKNQQKNFSLSSYWFCTLLLSNQVFTFMGTSVVHCD